MEHSNIKKEIDACFKNNNTNDIINLIERIDVNYEDENGMNLLMYSCFYKQLEVCQILLNKKMDPNKTNHREKFTPLMFATMSGSCEIVWELLKAKSSKTLKNKNNKTASQLASFIGQVNICRVIQSFVPLNIIEIVSPENCSYTHKIHIYSSIPSFNPLKIMACFYTIFNLRKSISQQLPLKYVVNSNDMSSYNNFSLETIHSYLENISMKVLECLSDEMHSFKVHIKAYIIEMINPSLNKNIMNQDMFDSLMLETYERVHKAIDNNEIEIMNKILLKSIETYKFKDIDCVYQLMNINNEAYKESNIIKCLEQTFFNDNNCKIDSNSDKDRCRCCFENGPLKRCSRCKKVYYCDLACQNLDWLVHKSYCQ